MDNETKQKINKRYERELKRGERFWPDSIFKDLIMSLGIFTLLILLATFIGVDAQPKVDPSDTTYIPRPEWYFLFLFKFTRAIRTNSGFGKDRMDCHGNCPRCRHFALDITAVH